MNLQDLTFDAFKEPRGFIKLLQWLFAICAFATTVNFSTFVEFQLNCQPKVNDTIPPLQKFIQYPFDLDQPYNFVKSKSCHNEEIEIQLNVNVKSDAEFFVTTGVLSFLYATALIWVYLLIEKRYQENNNAPIIDFVFTLIFAIFWLSSSAAWATGLGDLKLGTNLENLSKNDAAYICKDVPSCIKYTNYGAFTSIVISILFGFINFVLWAGNLWFLYKETTWFESILKNTAPSASRPDPSGA